MTPEAQQRLLDFTAEVVARESAKAFAAVQPGNGVEVSGTLVSVDPLKTRRSKDRRTSVLRAGQILVGDRVEVVPFVAPTRFPTQQGSSTGWLAPTIGGQSIFGTSRPALQKLSSGGAVYLVGRYDVTETWEYDTAIGNYIGRSGVLVGAEVTQVSLGQPPPYAPFVSQVTLDTTGTLVNESEYPKTGGVAYASTLLGVYTRDGAAIALVRGDRVSSFEDPMDGGSGPHFVGAPGYFPVEIEYNFVPPSTPP